MDMAKNNLNAADINGCTIASLLHQRIEKDDTKIWKPRKLIPEGAISQLQKNNIHDVRLLIIDEVSNIHVEKLGELSRLFGLAIGNAEEPFWRNSSSPCWQLQPEKTCWRTGHKEPNGVGNKFT